MKYLIILLMISIHVSGINAQTRDSVFKDLALSFGYQNRILLDEQKSALVYKSPEYLLSAGFTRTSPRSVIDISAEASTGHMLPKYIGERWLYIKSYDINGNPDIDSFPVRSGIIAGKIQFSWLNRLHSDKRLSFLAGGSVKDILVYPENNIGLINSLGLYIKLGSVIRLTRQSTLTSDISFPLIALSTRLPWHNTATDPIKSEITTFFRKGTNITGPDKFRLLEFNAKYGVQIAKRWNIGAAYSFTSLNVTYHKPLRSYYNSFRFVTAYTL